MLFNQSECTLYLNFFAFDVRRMQHIILGLLWYSVGFLVVLKGDLLWYSFRLTSAFSAPSWIIYLVGTKMSNTIYLICSLCNGCLVQWIACFPHTSEVSGSTLAMWDFFLFFCSHFVLFCFVLRKTYRKQFAASVY